MNHCITQQLAIQIEEVKDAEKLITTPDERIYFDSVLSKMTGQLEELLELREKVAYYEELITLTEQVCFCIRISFF